MIYISPAIKRHAPMTPENLRLLRDRAGEVAGMLKLLSHPNRLLVACELMDGERSVSQIEDNTGVRQPNLSRDLARLRAEGLVTTRRDARHIYYTLADPRISALMTALCAAFAPDGKPSQDQRGPTLAESVR
jgi:DNA-binding transcriptional ArsR family regulator